MMFRPEYVSGDIMMSICPECGAPIVWTRHELPSGNSYWVSTTAGNGKQFSCQRRSEN